MNVPFDDPQMLERFKALIDAILARSTHPIRYLSIGNEVDVYLAAHPQEWAAYTTFYDGRGRRMCIRSRRRFRSA